VAAMRTEVVAARIEAGVARTVVVEEVRTEEVAAAAPDYFRYYSFVFTLFI